MLGERFGSFKAVAKLGKGAMGEVFLAQHQRIDRRAAIKVLLPEGTLDAEMVRRFFIEARATSFIQHPGIVQIYDCDVHRNGRAYIVMEYLEGETLAKRLERFGVLPWSSACRITRLVADAISAAHEKKIIHRDIKPGNVFLLRDTDWPAAGGGQGVGLRGRQAPGGRRCRRTRHDGGTRSGNARIHVTRTLQRRQQGRPSRRRLFIGLHVVRDDRGGSAVHEQPGSRGAGLPQVQEAALAGGR